jgi:hypothetical protein
MQRRLHGQQNQRPPQDAHQLTRGATTSQGIVSMQRGDVEGTQTPPCHPGTHTSPKIFIQEAHNGWGLSTWCMCSCNTSAHTAPHPLSQHFLATSESTMLHNSPPSALQTTPGTKTAVTQLHVPLCSCQQATAAAATTNAAARKACHVSTPGPCPRPGRTAPLPTCGYTQPLSTTKITTTKVQYNKRTQTAGEAAAPSAMAAPVPGSAWN